MRILTLTHEFPPIGGGGGRIAFELARRMAGLGHHVEVITSGNPRLPAAEEVGGFLVRRVSQRQTHLAYSTNLEKLAYVRAASRELNLRSSAQFDVVHAHFILPAGLIAQRQHGDTPYIITCHGSDVPGHNPHEGQLEHRLLKSLWHRIADDASAIVSPSENLRELILNAGPNLLRTLHRIPNGYPCGKFRPTAGHDKILMVSRLIPLKGFHYFLQGIAGIDLGFEVNIVGDGPMHKELKALAAQTPTQVIFHGWLDNDSDELRELFETCSIFVFPSEAENFPTVLLEAMDAGQAIVTTDVKGCPEVAGEAAVTVPPRSPHALREAVQALIADPNARSRIGRQARQRVREEFDWTVIEARYQELYEALQRPGRKARGVCFA